jgi:UDPglucose 6-dehydrogenase
VLVSSQVPVGFTRALAADWKQRGLRYASSPENLRLGKAIASFEHAERTVVGLADRADQPVLADLVGPFCRRVEWMSLESAEMTKHALNAFLGTSVAFANEVARLCEVVGADAKEVQRGLQSEERIGPRAYVSPGAPFAGGTLARDLRYLVGFGRRLQVETPLFEGVLGSNRVHQGWLRDRVRETLEGVSGPVAAVLGLVYKPGTSTLRRSSALELCAWLHERGVAVRAHDPAAEELPEPLRAAVRRCGSRPRRCRGRRRRRGDSLAGVQRPRRRAARDDAPPARHRPQLGVGRRSGATARSLSRPRPSAAELDNVREEHRPRRSLGHRHWRQPGVGPGDRGTAAGSGRERAARRARRAGPRADT